MPELDTSPAPRMTVLEVLKSQCSSPQDRRNQFRFVWWTLGWAVSFVAATFLLVEEVVTGPTRWVVVALPALVLVQTVRTYIRFLRETDELTRRIQLDALATAFGITVVGLMGYSLVTVAGGPELGVDGLITAPMVIWALSQFVASLRYR